MEGLLMGAINLESVSDAELGAAVENNLFDLFRSVARLQGGELEETSRISRHYVFPTSPIFKGVWQTHLEYEEVDGAIKDALEFFRERQAPFCFWWTGPSTRAPGLDERLLAHGFQVWETDAPCMGAELSTLDYNALKRTPAGFKIELVTTQRQLEQFKQAFVAGMEIPAWAGQAWVDASLAFGIENAPYQMYVGLLDGEPVASNMLFNGGGIAGVYAVATVQHARRLGIGAAITLTAFQDALALGYRYGGLFSTALGEPVYRRIGFRRTGASISRYLWMNED